MMDLIRAGYVLFTVPIIILFVTILGLAARAGISLARGGDVAAFNRWIFHLGLFAFVFGLFGQSLGLYQAMGAIETAGNISPALLAGGLKVSFIATLFGLVTFVVALLLRLALDVAATRFGSS